MRRGARWALGVGAALVAMAAVSGASSDVLSINLDECSASCVPPTSDEEAAAEAASAGDVILSLFGGGRGSGNAHDARPDLVLDPEAVPSVLVSGPPSPIVSMGAQAFDGPGASPFAFFEEVIDVPLSIDPQSGLASAALSLFAPSSIGRLTLTDVLSNSNELFKPLPPLPPHLDPDM